MKELLPELSVDPLGYYVNSEQLSKQSYNSYEDYYRNRLSVVLIDLEKILSEQDYQDVCRVMINDIKIHANEWKIEQEGNLTIIKHDSGKKHYKSGFKEEEWREIEGFLNFVIADSLWESKTRGNISKINKMKRCISR